MASVRVRVRARVRARVRVRGIASPVRLGSGPRTGARAMILVRRMVYP